MFTYSEVIDRLNKGLAIPEEIEDPSSMEYSYYYMTKRWYGGIADSPEDIHPDKSKGCFFIYLSPNLYKKIKYSPSSFPDSYNGFPIIYKKKS